jgi:hypothetical protein
VLSQQNIPPSFTWVVRSSISVKIVSMDHLIYIYIENDGDDGDSWSKYCTLAALNY